MQITIITTEKKLSRSLITQMGTAGLDQVKNGKLLGYVRNIVKEKPKLLVIEHEGNYYTISCDYTKGENRIYRQIGSWGSYRNFKSENECNEFWKHYEEMVKAAKQIYI